MQKKAFALSLLGVSAMSVAAVATGLRPMHVVKILPAAVQSALPTMPAPQAEPRPAAPVYSPVPAGVAADLARWNSLRQTDSLPFSSYASFLISHRGWPGETAMRRTAEKANSDGGAAFEVIGFFSAFPPLTPAGHARHAFALQASGRGNEAVEAARKAWTGGLLPPIDEARILGQFGGQLTSADHDARLEALLGNGDTQSAARQLPLASAQRQALYATRLALQTRASDAASRLLALGAVDGDSGLLMDRANWLRASGQSLAARQLMAQPHRLSRPPVNAEKWFETMTTLAKGAANDSQWSTVYGIASQLDDAYPAGTDVSSRSYGERDEYTNLAWLAGTAASKLGRHADAARMYERYGRAAKSSQTRTKGFYWAARP
jgi:soluble lytic murein transglycosylase